MSRVTLHRTFEPRRYDVHLIILPTVLVIVAVSLVLRLIVRPILNPYRIRRPYFGPYGYYGYGPAATDDIASPDGLLAIALLVCLDRIFGRRW